MYIFFQYENKKQAKIKKLKNGIFSKCLVFSGKSFHHNTGEK